MNKYLLSLVLIFFSFITSADNSIISDLGEINYKNYENMINEKWALLIQDYLHKEKKVLNFDKSDKKYKNYVSEKLFEKEKELNKNNIDNDFKILDEYNRLLNLENINNITPIWKANNLLFIESNLNSSYTYYNRSSAVSYATYWAWKRNSTYWYYAWLRNCTNFTSQVLRAGWIPDKNDWTLNWRTKKENWYYWSIFQAPTYTWWWAHNFFQHAAATTTRYQNISNFWQLQLWDIVQIEYSKNWTIGHSMVVTKITWAWVNNIYLTYSNEYNIPSNDKLNNPLSTILQANPQTDHNYYAWRVIY